MKEECFNDINIKIGRNAAENWELLDTDPDFIWMHLNSFPSGHVIIEDSNPSDEILSYSALQCKENSKYKNLKNLKICYTRVGNLIKGEKVGSVCFKSKRKVKTIML